MTDPGTSRHAFVLIGYWQGDRSPGWPFPQDFVDETWNAIERELVAEYLTHGFVTRVFMGFSTCRMCGALNGTVEQTDRTYVWPQGFAHYVRDHGVRPPQEFVDHALALLSQAEGAPYDESWWRSFARPEPS